MDNNFMIILHEGKILIKMQDSYKKIFKNLSRILVVLAHPDDMEVVCGGLVKRLTDDGKIVRCVVATNGGKGSKDKVNLPESKLAELRIKEQQNAAGILGIDRNENFNLGVPDGEFEPILDNIEKIVYHIREFKPDLVITHNPEDVIIRFSTTSNWVNHRDHRNTGLATFDACYPYSRDTNFFPDQVTKLGTHTVTKILYADAYLHTNALAFEISEQIEAKRKALLAHKNGIGAENVDGYIEENQIGQQYFEKVGYLEIY